MSHSFTFTEDAPLNHKAKVITETSFIMLLICFPNSPQQNQLSLMLAASASNAFSEYVFRSKQVKPFKIKTHTLKHTKWVNSYKFYMLARANINGKNIK